MENYQKSIHTFHSAALDYEKKFMEMDLYNDAYDFFCSLLPEKASVLDVGCGPGNITRYLLGKRDDLIITGIDLAPNMVERARVNNPTAGFLVLDALDIDQLPGLFNGIVIGFCMPFLSKEDCGELIRKAAGKLEDGGWLYISTMEDDYDKSGYETTSFSDGKEIYFYYHQEDFLVGELVKSGMEIVKLDKKAYPEPDGSFLTDLIIIVRNGRD